MPTTPYIYATLSQQVYQDGGGTPPVGWQIFARSNDFGLGSPYGYYGVAYMDSISKELIIAHRGTAVESFDTPGGGEDIYNDIQLALGNTPDQDAVARQFIAGVTSAFISQFPEFGSPTLTFTGHSLGAVLAELSAIEENVAAVTFDSPGSYEIIQNMIAEGSLPADSLTRAEGLFTCYNAAPNLVNTVNQHAGKVNRVYPFYDATVSDVGGATSSLSYIYFTAQQHAIDGIHAQFDAVTGNPKVVSEQNAWPLGNIGISSGYDVFFKSYNNNPEYWDEYCAIQGISGQAKTDFITNDLGGITTLGGTGVTITADSTAPSVWGATTKIDTINSHGGSPLLAGFEGKDVYNIHADNAGNIGKPSIIDRDSDGLLYINGQQLSGTASPVTNRAEGTTYTLKSQDNNLYILTRMNEGGVVSSDGMHLQVKPATDGNIIKKGVSIRGIPLLMAA